MIFEEVDVGQNDDGDGKRKGGVGIGRWDDFQVMDAELGSNAGEEIHRHHVHDVPEQHPAEDGEGERADVGARGAEEVFNDAIDEVKDHFGDVDRERRRFVVFEVLQGALSHFAHPPAEQAAEQDGEEQGIDMQGPEAFANAEVGHVMADDFCCALFCHTFLLVFQDCPEIGAVSYCEASQDSERLSVLDQPCPQNDHYQPFQCFGEQYRADELSGR